MKNKTIEVLEKREAKKGNTNGKDWTLTILKDQDGLEFSTFNGHLYKIGDQKEVIYTEEQKGKFIRRALQDTPKKENGNKVDPEYARTVSIQLERIEEKQDEIIDRLEKMANFLLENQK